MTTATLRAASAGAPEPPLEQGDNLDQPTFHRRYRAMPHKRAELIEGVVHMPSAPKSNHGDVHGEAICWLKFYKAQTKGVRVLDNATTILGDCSEPQPDASLLIVPDHGGQTHLNQDNYLVGAPEMVVEVALSSVAIDLYGKRRDYEAAGVLEYLVLVLGERRAIWFVRRGQGFETLDPGPDGIHRSLFFGGLWLDSAALMQCDTIRVQEVLLQGLASADHAAFPQRWPRL